MNLLDLFMSPAFAETAHQAKETIDYHSQGGMSFIDYIFHSNIINFIIVVAFLLWLNKVQKFTSIIDQRQEEISTKVLDSEESKMRAEFKLEETKKQLSSSNEKIDTIVKDGKEVAKSLSSEIIIEAKTYAKDIEAKTENVIDTKRTQAVSEIKTKITGAAFEIAREHIKQSLDDRMHHKFIDEFIEGLDNLKV